MTTTIKWHIIPLVKSKLLKHNKFKEDNGNITEVKIWQTRPSADRLHGYKYSLVYIVNGKRVIGYDNSESKGDHSHYGNKEERFDLKGIDKLFEGIKNLLTIENLGNEWYIERIETTDTQFEYDIVLERKTTDS